LVAIVHDEKPVATHSVIGTPDGKAKSTAIILKTMLRESMAWMNKKCTVMEHITVNGMVVFDVRADDDYCETLFACDRGVIWEREPIVTTLDDDDDTELDIDKFTKIESWCTAVDAAVKSAAYVSHNVVEERQVRVAYERTSARANGALKVHVWVRGVVRAKDAKVGSGDELKTLLARCLTNDDEEEEEEGAEEEAEEEKDPASLALVATLNTLIENVSEVGKSAEDKFVDDHLRERLASKGSKETADVIKELQQEAKAKRDSIEGEMRGVLVSARDEMQDAIDTVCNAKKVATSAIEDARKRGILAAGSSTVASPKRARRA